VITQEVRYKLLARAYKYNDPAYFQEDPISFPRKFVERGADLRDIEIAALFAAHLAWGRRAMIVRDLGRLFDAMDWQPLRCIMEDGIPDNPGSLHRTIKWSEAAQIGRRLKSIYNSADTIEDFPVERIRTEIFGSAPDRNAANKKINMMRRWMVRDDGKVDFGLWKRTDKRDLLIPLDVHVMTSAATLGLTGRHSADYKTALEITSALSEVFPGDPCLGDFALFGHGVTGGNKPCQTNED